MQEIANNAPERFKAKKGFISAVFYSDKEKNEYGSTVVWETKEDYEAHSNSILPETREKIAAIISEPSVRNIYYVNNNF